MLARVLIAAFALAALIFAVRDTGDHAFAGTAVPLEQGLVRVDSFLQNGLSKETHGVIAGSISNSVTGSVDFSGQLGDKIQRIIE
jgi:hypothetical protein